jgi:DsbC/DsbD-like thiol-disulfide interchange protein
LSGYWWTLEHETNRLARSDEPHQDLREDKKQGQTMKSSQGRANQKFQLVGLGLVFASLALTLGTMSPASAGGGKDESQVKFTTSAERPDRDGVQKITIKMAINSGYYAYANPVENEDLEPAQTVVKVTSAQKLQDVKIAYPAGTPKSLDNIKYKAYEGTVDIIATVKRAQGDTSPLDLTVKFSVCNVKGFCLPPEQVKLQVK